MLHQGAENYTNNFKLSARAAVRICFRRVCPIAKYSLFSASCARFSHINPVREMLKSVKRWANQQADLRDSAARNLDARDLLSYTYIFQVGVCLVRVTVPTPLDKLFVFKKRSNERGAQHEHRCQSATIRVCTAGLAVDPNGICPSADERPGVGRRTGVSGFVSRNGGDSRDRHEARHHHPKDTNEHLGGEWRGTRIQRHYPY